MTFVKQRLLLFLVPLFLALPFLNRAYFVDDYFFVEIARWVKDNPETPYDFPTHGLSPDAGTSRMDASMPIVNPLVHHYYLAALMTVGGEREWFLRLGCVLLSCFSALLIFELARRWLEHPFWVTLLVLVTPVHWLTSYSLLIDSTMSFLFLSALVAFIRAAEEDSPIWFIVSGLFMGTAVLSKYTALFILPLSWTYVFFFREKIRRPALAAIPSAITLAMLSAYVAATSALYGQGHLFAASGQTLHGVNLGKILVLLVFLTGSSIAPLMVWLTRGPRALMIALPALLGAIFLFAGPFALLPLGPAALFALWLVTALLLLAAFASHWRDWQAYDRFLFIWLLGFLGMMTLVMQWVAVRYYMMAASVLIFVCARMIEWTRPKHALALLKGTIAVTFLMGLSLAYADYKQAESSRFVVGELDRQKLLKDARGYYQAEAFTMTYLAREGWKPSMDTAQQTPGDRIVASEITLPLGWFLRTKVPMREVATIEYPSSFPIKVMDARAGAGFYASAWGPLPFTISSGPWERFHLFEIIPE